MKATKTSRLGVDRYEQPNNENWKAAQQAAVELIRVLSLGVEQLRQPYCLSNAYLPVAFLRYRTVINTLTAGMECMRLVCEGRSNWEIRKATGLSIGTIAAYKAWNTMYSRRIMLALKATTLRQQDRSKRRSGGKLHG
jgi:hypothetical protein